ncbi:helix-turn-helix domain-containing protein [Candidatus Gottesmanbacteria bacterium]|nr:helix-turn-helix domain-containing protein [Candidatus Gottesmanbacteria bacterium]
MEPLFNVNQAAFILKVHPLTIRRYIKEGKLKAVRAGGNVRIKESELVDFNKDVSPGVQSKRLTVRKNVPMTKVFTPDDPLFRLVGRGAHIELST